MCVKATVVNHDAASLLSLAKAAGVRCLPALPLVSPGAHGPCSVRALSAGRWCSFRRALPPEPGGSGSRPAAPRLMSYSCALPVALRRDLPLPSQEQEGRAKVQALRLLTSCDTGTAGSAQLPGAAQVSAAVWIAPSGTLALPLHFWVRPARCTHSSVSWPLPRAGKQDG